MTKTRNGTRLGIITPDVARDCGGKGGFINPKHGGILRRPAEGGNRVDDLTPKDIKSVASTESPMNNPGYGGVGERKG